MDTVYKLHWYWNTVMPVYALLQAFSLKFFNLPLIYGCIIVKYNLFPTEAFVCCLAGRKSFSDWPEPLTRRTRPDPWPCVWRGFVRGEQRLPFLWDLQSSDGCQLNSWKLHDCHQQWNLVSLHLLYFSMWNSDSTRTHKYTCICRDYFVMVAMKCFHY